MILTGMYTSTNKETCPTALSTTDPTWAALGLNLGLRGERPRTDRLSHATDSDGINGEKKQNVPRKRWQVSTRLYGVNPMT